MEQGWIGCSAECGVSIESPCPTRQAEQVLCVPQRPKNTHPFHPCDHAFDCCLSPQGSLSQPKHSSALEALPGLQECGMPRSVQGDTFGKEFGVERTPEMHHHPYPCQNSPGPCWGAPGVLCRAGSWTLILVGSSQLRTFHDSLCSLCHRTTGTVLAPRPGHTPAAAVGSVWLNRSLLLSTQHPYMIREEPGPF